MKKATSPDCRLSCSTLSEGQLKFFHKILAICESGKEPKVVRDFRYVEVKRFCERKRQLQIEDIDTKSQLNSKSKILLRDDKGNKALSILWHLRHAFAHNRIIRNGNTQFLQIRNEHNGVVKMKANVQFGVLKELVEIFLGEHNLTDIEKKSIEKEKRKKKKLKIKS